ncbi:TnsA endonuclease N-terminal domain-containing protein [Rugamonas sp. DEMB1]|uniref:TnsA endonuclease N-terminal domain-containing protein n=1 Tax=Rugamonas sp. DEMB1 TaxID=3039386 RepID=UPI00244960D3|nr:TnsA endonuclease N-terminal domain-containing protein [Rugamonas sp. DEMB1]WGG50950.1 TnsA endonuclease N-terminal domain-containing protein [Rugamonas sp. DEMB1]
MSETTQQLAIRGDSDDPSELTALSVEPIPKTRLQKGMTHKKLCERIQLGHGIGHGSRYLPWLILRRKNPSPYSNQVASSMPPLGRGAYYFSRGEYHTALMLLWLGVLDLREQFPLWPMAHPHPLDGTPGAAAITRPWSRGLLDIAREAGIDHGYEIGTGVPYVASLDLLATVPLKSGYALAGFSSKPIAEPDEEVKWRTLERLELERRYIAGVCGTYFVSSSALVPKLTAGHLEAWLDASTLHCAPHLIVYAAEFTQHLNAYLDQPINETVIHASQALRLTTDEAWLLFRHCAWTQSVDIDPSRRILTSYPILAGGRALRDNLRRRFFGETWS